ncbi:uncharacterized protein BXZ73DRAFT_98567 [Epithele typhae]|uniref:uncharacterized protein n=1 Tax=Epithele typhae TaxID=378194 RepID=UPI002008AAD6|nr:uncharacterized protein BXZ73DRAFT_98567 [Epithele typhae]KAH9940737.1 hypothetical protein BXZ73DRAFT_98567 [Epithele typhae]
MNPQQSSHSATQGNAAAGSTGHQGQPAYNAYQQQLNYASHPNHAAQLNQGAWPIQQAPLAQPYPIPAQTLAPAHAAAMDGRSCAVCGKVFGRWQDRVRHEKNCLGSGQRSRQLYGCYGITAAEAARRGVPQAAIAHTQLELQVGSGSKASVVRLFGGCGTSFTRKDAYKRHLTVRAGTCWGDEDAYWQPGNQ